MKTTGQTEQIEPAEKTIRISTYAASASSVGFIFQVSMIYWFSAMYKYAPSADDSWSSGKALDLALRFKAHSTSVSQFMLSLPPIVLVVLTHVSGLLESVGPFLFMSPLHTSFFRGVGVVSFVGFHLGIAVTLDIGIFPFYSCSLFVPLIPKEWWAYICCDQMRKCNQVAVGSGKSGDRDSGSSSSYNNSSTNTTDSGNSNHTHEKGTTVVRETNVTRITKTQYIKQHGTTIVQQMSIVFISLFIFWWQASNIENGVPIPKVAREACAVLGVKQHWKLFTNLSSSITGNFDCRPVLIGVIKTPKEQQHDATINPDRHVNLLQWKQDDYFNNSTMYQSVEQVLRDDKPNIQRNEHQMSFYKYIVNALTATSTWARWTTAIRSNEFAMMTTGDYFCRLWNRKRKINITVTMDGQKVDIVYGLKPTAVINAAKDFCKHYKLSNEQCQQLYETMVEKSNNERLHHYYYLSVCEFGKVHGIQQYCYENDNRLSFEKDTRDLPMTINEVFQDLA